MSWPCEVRVEGVLGRSILRHLAWSHRVVPEQTLVRVDATPADLHRFLWACIDAGLVIESVHPVERGSDPVSRDRADGRDAPRPPGGLRTAFRRSPSGAS